MIARTVTAFAILIAAVCNWLLFYESVNYTPFWYAVPAATWTLAGMFFTSWWLFGFGRTFDAATRLVCRVCLLMNVVIVALGVLAFIVRHVEPQLIPIRAIAPAVLAWMLIEITTAICLPPLLTATMSDVYEIEDRRARLTRAQLRDTKEEFSDSFLTL